MKKGWSENLESSAQWIVEEVLQQALDRVGDEANYASPIEHAMAVAMAVQIKLNFPEIGFHPGAKDMTEVRARQTAQDLRDHPPPMLGCVFRQVELSPYRVDFLILHSNLMSGFGGIVVECDGHEFHERTKEQAAKDKARDRDLQDRGYKVFRFTGAEIWADAFQCARSALILAHTIAIDSENARHLMAGGDFDGAMKALRYAGGVQ